MRSAALGLFVLCCCFIASSTASIYWGAYINIPNGTAFPNWPPSDQPMRDFQAHSGGKGLSLVHWGLPWFHGGSFQSFPTGYADVIRNYGAIPVLDWGSWDYCCGPTQADYTLARIYGGAFDSFLHSFAQQVKAWSHPLFLRFDWEMNGWWQFPWAEQINGNKPGDYVKMWRHVHDIFTSEGVTNVAWVWCPNIISPQSTSLQSLYPGDAYVDWTCLDGYNEGQLQGNPWMNITEVFRGGPANRYMDSYADILAVAPSKPLMIGETGCTERGNGSKAQWLRDAITLEIPRMSAVKAFAYFNWGDGGADWPIESSAAAQAAWGQALSSSTYYLGNIFANLTRSSGSNPIPPYEPPSPATTTPPPMVTTGPPTTPPATTTAKPPTPAPTTPSTTQLTTHTATSAPSTNSIYWGAWIQIPGGSHFPNWPPSDQPMLDFQAHSGGKGLSIVHWAMPWFHFGAFQKFPSTYNDVIRSYGAIPMLTWGSWDYCCGPIQANWTLARVYSGVYDSFIHSFAQGARAWGHPLFIRFNHEMNGWWQFPWAEQINGNKPGDYVRAWRHVHDIFRAENVTNIAWVWCPNIISAKSTPLSSLYPGDSYVDWTCLDGYNFGPLRESSWLNFTQVYRGYSGNRFDSYANITAVAPNKPIMIGEWGCAEKLDGGAAKAKWLTDALTKEILSMPAIRVNYNFRIQLQMMKADGIPTKAVVYFDWDVEALPGHATPSNVSWPIETSNAAQSAWATAISQTPNYVSNLFANLSPVTGPLGVNPIPPYSPPTVKPTTPVPTTTQPPTTIPTARLPTPASTSTTRPPTPPPTTAATPLTHSPAPQPTSGPLYWGAWITIPNGTSFPSNTDQPMRNFQAHSGNKGLSIVHWGLPWYHADRYQSFPTSSANIVRDYGAIPLLDWGSWDYCCGNNQPNFTLAKVYSGAHDTYIRDFARQVKAWAAPLWIRFNPEMNGNWLPWSETVNTNKPGEFVHAWHHVRQIFRNESVANVAWVWCPNVISPQLTPLAELYPGDADVDWTCLDGYNMASLQNNPWINFTQVFRGSSVNGNMDSYAAVLAVAPSKPMMIGEWGSMEALPNDNGVAKAKWLLDALKTEIPAMPAIKAVVYFDWAADGANWPVESSAAAQVAWATGIQSPFYAANIFRNVTVAVGSNPIPPLLPAAPVTTTTHVPTPPPAATLPSDYVGCYIDQASPRALTGLTTNSSYLRSSSLTISMCQKFCGLRGYALAGLQYGVECWCGQSTSGGALASSDLECNLTCAGDSLTRCGGRWRNSIYRSAAGFKGCFIDNKDTNTSRDLSVRAASSLNMTIEYCISVCARRNYTYAGLQWSHECWCGNSYGRYGQVAFAQCNMTCAADDTQMCGGSLRNSIYVVGSAVIRLSESTDAGSATTHHAFPWWAVMGIVVAGILVAVALLALVIVVVHRRNKKTAASAPTREKLLS